MNIIRAADALENKLACRARLVRLAADQHIVNAADEFGGQATIDTMIAQMKDDVNLLDRSNTMYWTKATTDAVLAIAPSINPQDTICSRELLHTDNGFAWFEEPWLKIETQLRGGEMLGLLWSYVYSQHHGRELIQLSAFCKVGRWVIPIGHCRILVGDPIERIVPPALPMGLPPASDGRYSYMELDRGRHTEDGVKMIRFAVCAGMFLRQKLAVVEEQRLNRPARRRLSAAGWVGEPEVSVVLLRERERRAVAAGEGERHYDNWQWLVGGHVRQQYYPSLGKNLPVLISPYIKGPEGKPMKPRTTPIYLVNR